MSMVDAIKSVFSKYATFSGRARRSEYWWYYLATAILGIVLSAIVLPISLSSIGSDGQIGVGYFGAMVPLWVIALALFLPTLAVTVRRLHDTGRSGGWWFINLVPVVGTIILIVFLATEGTAGENTYGPDPKMVPVQAA